MSRGGGIAEENAFDDGEYLSSILAADYCVQGRVFVEFVDSPLARGATFTD